MGRDDTNETSAQGFQPIDPWESEGRIFTRRNLPHLEVPGATYFVTFRCVARVVLPPEVRDAVIAEAQACDRVSIDLEAAVVMPDHAHMIFRVLGHHRLGQVIRRIKGRSARQSNRMLKTNSPVWMDESFDHIIRDETELQEKIEYIRQNPVKGGLEDRAGGYRWLYVRNTTG